ncbi:RNA polymerase sigma-70 factor [Sphingobacterium lactis]|uniref:RNA polymerase sigma-70 factor n=1 Tax=Sphingobacterium lactis TaxID=797291 RepID=UPI003F800566
MDLEEKRKIFTVLYEAHWKRLFLHAYQMLDDQDEAKDIVQEVFSNLWESLDSLTIQQSYNAYLYRSIRNVVINKLARNKLGQTYLKFLDAPSFQSYVYNPEETLREKDFQDIINQEIELLPSKMRSIFKKSRYENMSYKEIAADLGIAEGTVKKQIYKALLILKQKLKFIFILMYH